jgi:hypothetical protein
MNQQEPPFAAGDWVHYIPDRDHVEVVETCEWIAEAVVPHWRVTTTWSRDRRVADATEFVIEGAP